MESEKIYYAFVSYSREDEKWAKWVAHEMDNFKLPTALNGKELPNSLRKVFRDVDELSAGNLPEQIHNALSTSENLVVICSPHSAKSKWVDEEIKEFIKIKGDKTNKIFPFIIDGTPFSNDSNDECFPESLRNLSSKDERVGGNVNEQGGREAALIKVIAGMLEVSFDSLWNRYEREQKRKRRLWIALAFLVAFIGISIASWMWRLNQQLSESNRKLSIENIRMASKEIENFIEQGDYPSANGLLDEIMTIWHDDFSQEDVPEFERALRKMFRYVNDNGLVKLYDISLSNKQHYLYADSDYVYIADYEQPKPRLLRYHIGSGRFDKQIDLLLRDTTDIEFYGLKDGLLVYKRTEPDNVKEFRVYNIATHADQLLLRDSVEYYFVGIQPQGRMLFFRGAENFTSFPDFASDSPLKIFKFENNIVKEECNLMVKRLHANPTIVGDTLFTLNDTHVYAYSIPDGECLYDIDYKKYEPSSDGTFNVTKVDPVSKKFAISFTDSDLMLFNAERPEILNIEKMHGSGAVCILQDLVAATKLGSPDSLFVYFANKDYVLPLLVAREDGIGFPDLDFVGNNYLVASNRNSVRMFQYSMQFETKGLYAPNGRFYVGEDSQGLPAVMDEQTDSVLYYINDHIENIYSFSPKSNYLICGFAENIFCLIDLNTAKIKKIGITPSDPNYDAVIREIAMSSDEKILAGFVREYRRGIFGQQSHSRVIAYDVKMDSVLLDQVFADTTSSFMKEDIFAISVNSDGSKIALRTLSDISYINLPLSKGRNHAQLVNYVPNVSPERMAFGHSKDTLTVTYSDGTIRFWDLKNGQQVFRTIETGRGSGSFDISRDFQYLIESVPSDGVTCEIMVWHIPSGRLVDHFESKEIKLLRKVYDYIQRDCFGYGGYDVTFASDDPSCIIITDRRRFMSVKAEFPSFSDLLKWAKKIYD